jgi:hypothetical protein
MSRNQLLATLVQDSSGDITLDRLDKLVDNTIEPEILNAAVDVDSAGHHPDWKWSWNPTTLPYARENITMQAQNDVPIYKSGTYSLINFTAFRMRDSATQTHKMYLKWIEEPGLNNLVDWVTYDSGNFTFEGVTGDSSTRAQRLRWTVPASYTIPSLNTSTVNYNVGAVSGAYVHTGVQMGQNTAIGPLRRGNTYNFVLDATTAGHPFYLSTDDGTGYISNNYVGEYLHGVTNSRGTNGTVTFVVPDSAPSTMTYQCGVHSAMRGNITIKDLKTDSNGSGQDTIYFQHSQEGHATPSPVKAVPSIVGQMCLTYDAAKTKYVPQDLREYMEKTASFTSKIREEIKAQSVDSSKTLGLLRTKNILNSSNVFTAAGLDSAKVTNLVQTSVIDSDYVATKLGFTDAASSSVQKEQNTTLVQDGALSVLTGTARWYSPRNVQITKIRSHVTVAPAGANLNLDLKKNGVSIQTFNITAGSTTSVNTGLTHNISEGDYLTVDITQIGSSTAGSNLNIVISYK